MLGKQQSQNLLFRTNSHPAKAALAMVILFALMVMLSALAQGQTFKVIHDFTGERDGANPYAGLTMDAGGNLYGTTYGGGAGYGGVFRLRQAGSGWVFNPLYNFAGGGANDGAGPYIGALTFGPNGTLYGATLYGGGTGCGGSYSGCGTVFNLRPQARVCKSVLCPWSETVVYRFSGGSDGAHPNGDLVFDQAGNIYGSASGYAQSPPGLIFQLTPSGGTWSKSELYSLRKDLTEHFPRAGLSSTKPEISTEWPVVAAPKTLARFTSWRMQDPVGPRTLCTSLEAPMAGTSPPLR